MVRRAPARRNFGTKVSLRKCIRPCWRINLRALDEIRTSLSCLIRRSCEHVYQLRFSATPLHCSFVRRFSFADFGEKLFSATYAAIKAGRYRWPLDSTAHVIRASLCAMATITTLRCALASRLLIQAPTGERSRFTRNTSERAPWINIVRR